MRVVRGPPAPGCCCNGCPALFVPTHAQRPFATKAAATRRLSARRTGRGSFHGRLRLKPGKRLAVVDRNPRNHCVSIMKNGIVSSRATASSSWDDLSPGSGARPRRLVGTGVTCRSMYAQPLAAVSARPRTRRFAFAEANLGANEQAEVRPDHRSKNGHAARRPQLQFIQPRL